jgi:outer membrane protein, heavy metal efflux system
MVNMLGYVLLVLMAAAGMASAAPGSVATPPIPESHQSDGSVSLPAPLTAETFTEAVLEHNASLEAMRQSVVAAVKRVEPAGKLDDPMLSISAAPRTFGAANGPNGDVEVSQTLPWWGTLDARKEAAQAEAEAASQDFVALRLQLAMLARRAFADWAYIQHAFEVNDANVSLLAELRNVARIRYTTGQAPQEDVLQADVERVLLKQQRLELEREHTVVQARMNALLDRSPQTAIPEPGALPDTMSVPAEEILSQRALGHPRLEQLAAQRRAAQARQTLVEKERYPRFGLSTGYNNMWSDPAMRPMVGLSFTIPLDQSKYRDEIDAARAEVRRAASTLEDERASVLADLSGTYAKVRESAQSIALYRDELVPLARSALEVARSDYGAGRGGFLNVLIAERHRLDTELGLARTESEYYRALAELDRATGGGLLAVDRLTAQGHSP